MDAHIFGNLIVGGDTGDPQIPGDVAAAESESEKGGPEPDNPEAGEIEIEEDREEKAEVEDDPVGEKINPLKEEAKYLETHNAGEGKDHDRDEDDLAVGEIETVDWIR